MSTDRIPELDWLRFTAASAVLVYHNTYRVPVAGVPSEDAFPLIQSVSRFGYLGVNLFFIISGFVILWSVGSKSVREFAATRALRLYPTFWAALLVTMVFVVWMEPAGNIPGPREFASNLTMLPGFLGSAYVDGVYWTLAAEMKFYFLIAIMISFRQIETIERWLWVWMAALAICAIGVNVPALSSLTLFPFGSLFAGGCWAYLIRSRGITRSRLVGLLVSMVLSLAAIPMQAEQFMHDVTSGEIVMSMAIVAASFLAVLCIAMKWWRTTFGRIAATLGALTYPLYLVHNRIGKAISASLEGRVPLGLKIALVSAVAFLIAWAITRLVEGGLVRKIGKSRTFRMLAGKQPA